MKGLFWRVFAWYLGTTVMILGVGAGVMMVTDPEFSFTRAVSVSRESLRTQGEDAVRIWRRGGPPALASSFSKGRPRFLFDSALRELSGRPAASNLKDLARRTLASEAVELEFMAPETFAGLGVEVDGNRYVFVRELKDARHFRDFPHPLPVWSRVVLGLLTALLICFLFARYVTSPLRRLRAATREFAAGNLQVRIGRAKPFHRDDEFTGLASDFDNMATQIQVLVLSQQRMLGDISHELRSPLTRLQLALEIARRKAGPGAEIPLDRIEQEAEKLNTLIGQILRAVQSKHLQSGRKVFDLAHLVREIVEDADFEALAKHRRVVLGLCEMSLVHGNRESLCSAIENVVRNAIRYAPEESQITVDLKLVDPRKDAACAAITVRDRGPGVPSEALAHLFEPFYRVNAARDRDSGGAGLGLAITHSAVSAHGGTVYAINHPEGGFEVRIEFPLKALEAGSRSGIRFRSS